ncbi:domain of Kin17 curved DNA-binding protein-domain-containing protein [Hypoxylon argillaceum]|nr:domain of Kin17 curved DNA-binding protein-domain-containing protein [Hypoxylon argillaceum]
MSAKNNPSRQLDKRMKAKGLGRLRWYCTPCQKQCRDENAFKQHTLSEGHVRTVQAAFDGPIDKAIDNFSSQFQSDFLKLLKTSHGEKAVQVNRFYQIYIAQRDHVHLNATRWRSLTEFAKSLGREGLCRVEEKEDGEGGVGGFYISYIDRSPSSISRQEALARAEKQDSTSAKIEARMLKQQIDRASRAPVAESQQPTEVIRTPGEAIQIQLPKITIQKKQQPSARERPNVFRAAKKKLASETSGGTDADRQAGKRTSRDTDTIGSDDRSVKRPRNN